MINFPRGIMKLRYDDLLAGKSHAVRQVGAKIYSLSRRLTQPAAQWRFGGLLAGKSRTGRKVGAKIYSLTRNSDRPA